MKKQLLFPALFLLFLPGCGLLSAHSITKEEGFEAPSAIEEALQEIPETAQSLPKADALTKEPPSQTTNIEIIWQVPEEAVRYYHLHWGYAQAQSQEQIKISVGKLEQFDHPNHGPVFRYTLRNIPRGKNLYVSLTAENKHGVSPKSQTFEVRTPGR